MSKAAEGTRKQELGGMDEEIGVVSSGEEGTTSLLSTTTLYSVVVKEHNYFQDSVVSEKLRGTVHVLEILRCSSSSYQVIWQESDEKVSKENVVVWEGLHLLGTGTTKLTG